MNIQKYINFFSKYLNLFIDKYKKNYKSNLAIAAIMKNEAPYVREWIEYHKLVGVDKFYIYDNESTDNLKEVLQPYINGGDVVYSYIPGRGVQVDAYCDAIKKYKFASKYIAIIDTDEFILPVQGDKNAFEIVDELLSSNPKAAGLALQWCIYGSGGHKTKPEGLVIENYLMHAKDDAARPNKHIKTICNPRRIKCPDIHHCVCYSGYNIINTKSHHVDGIFNEEYCWDILRINHYFSKSYEEFLTKRSRGMADLPQGEIRPISHFYIHNYNEVKDSTILRYAEELKKRLSK